jgi:hypothetical protein
MTERMTGMNEHKIVRGERMAVAKAEAGTNTRRVMACGMRIILMMSRKYSENWKCAALESEEDTFVAWRMSSRNSMQLSVNVQANIGLASVGVHSLPAGLAEAGVGRVLTSSAASIRAFGRDLRQTAKRTGRARMRYICEKASTAKFSHH